MCDSYLYGEKSDFFSEYSLLIPEVWKCYIQRILSDAPYGFSLIDDTDLFERIEYSLSLHLDGIYNILSKVGWSLEDIGTYKQFVENLDAHIQSYSVSSICSRCESAWEKCCSNSEFAPNTTFNCPQREYLGAQKYAKLNGLILSNTECATLFDNSLKFRCKKNHLEKVVEEIYYIVNVDLSRLVSSLPVPQNIDEALRLRKREEIASLRNIFLEWSHHLYCGNIDEAQYIKKYFDEAIAFMEKRRIDSNKKKSILRCCFEALGNQIPYISNLLGAISPFLNRKSVLAEERHKWILLTR